MSVINNCRETASAADKNVEEEDLSPLLIGPSEHKLQYTYGLWYTGKTNYLQYDSSLQRIGRFASVEQFWALYSHLICPCDLSFSTNFYVFKDGIKPLWEHKDNSEGGHWFTRLNKGVAARCWENLILAILGEQFNVGDEICGAGITTRGKKDYISIWNKTCSDQELVERIGDTFRNILNLPTHFRMEYRYHKDLVNWMNQRRQRDGVENSSIWSRTPTTSGFRNFSSGLKRPNPRFARSGGTTTATTLPSSDGLGGGAP